MTRVIVSCENLVQIYGTEGQQVTALRGVDLTVTEGESVALLGVTAGVLVLAALLASRTLIKGVSADLLRQTAE